MMDYQNVTDIGRNAAYAPWKHTNTHTDTPELVPVASGLILVLRVMLVCFFCLGVIGNVLTITSIALTRSLHSVPNVYLCSLAASDLTICIIAMPSTFVGYTVHIPDELCVVLAEIIFSCIMVSLMSITMVAVNRYVLVVKPRQYYVKVYQTKNVKISICIIWLLGTVYGMPPNLGFGEYFYNHKMGGCFVRADTWDSWLFAKVFGMGLAFLPAMLTSLYCYINIGLTFSRARRKVASADTDGATIDVPCVSNQMLSRSTVMSTVPENSSVKQDAATRRRSVVMLLKKLAVVWGLFMCCWLPVALTHSADFTGEVDARVLHVAFALAQCNSAMNVITYGALSKDIRAAYRRTLSCKRA